MGDYSAPLMTTLPSESRSMSTEFGRPGSGWINTVPLSSNVSTLSKRSTGFGGRKANRNDHYVKEYMKKRNLILALMVMTINKYLSPVS